jgi:hypothetical protein
LVAVGRTDITHAGADLEALEGKEQDLIVSSEGRHITRDAGGRFI